MTTQAMNHEDAVKTLAAERYLLREMNAAERASFEEHYLACAECFEAVTASFEFAAAAKQVLASEASQAAPAGAGASYHPVERPAASSVHQRTGWLAKLFHPQWAPAFALLLLCAAGLGVYQGRIIHDLKGAQVAPRFPISGASKAEARTLTVAREGRMTLVKEFVPSDEFTSYEVELVNSDGIAVTKVPFTATPSQENVELSVYAATLQPGDYSIVVQGVAKDGTKKELARGPFRLQFS